MTRKRKRTLSVTTKIFYTIEREIARHARAVGRPASHGLIRVRIVAIARVVRGGENDASRDLRAKRLIKVPRGHAVARRTHALERGHHFRNFTNGFDLRGEHVAL